MARLRNFSAFLLGFILATIAGMLLRASPAMAQQAWSDLSIARPSTEPPRPVRRSQVTTPDDAEPSAPIPVNAGEYQPQRDAAPSARRIVQSERGQQDGETEQPVGIDLAVDGHMEVGEPPLTDDGREPVIADPRLPADSAAFLAPPAGYDALAFQIELDPATDARVRRLTALEPFTAVGRRSGNWVVFPTVEMGIGGTTNVYRSTTARPDLIFDVRSTLLAVSDWQQHALLFKATGFGSAYGTYASENEKSYAFEMRGRLDITKRSNIEILAIHSLDQEPRSSLFAPTDARTPTPYSTDKIAVAYNQRFNHVSVQLRGAVTDLTYQPVATYDGGLLNNAERNVSVREVALRTAWNFHPTLAIFAESAFNNQVYTSMPADGIARDGIGDRLKAGLSFGNLAQIWRGEFAVGYGHQHARDGRLGDAQGLLVDANIGWKPTALTSLLFNAHTDFLTSTVAGQGNATQRLVGVELRHALQRRLIAIAGLSYQVTAYQGISLVERTTTAELGFEYSVSQSTTLLGRYSHIVLDSSTPNADTTTDAVRLGVRYRP